MKRLKAVIGFVLCMAVAFFLFTGAAAASLPAQEPARDTPKLVLQIEGIKIAEGVDPDTGKDVVVIILSGKPARDFAEAIGQEVKHGDTFVSSSGKTVIILDLTRGI